jgi:hypothetical protein
MKKKMQRKIRRKMTVAAAARIKSFKKPPDI